MCRLQILTDMIKIRKLIWDIPVLSDVQKKFYDVVMERRYKKVFLPLYRKMVEKREESVPERKERGR